MPRDIPVGNGNLLVNFDNNYQIRDIYYPYVGLENHSVGFPFRFGVWADGEFSWMGDAWEKSLKYLPETLVTDVHVVNRKLGIELACNDAVDIGRNVFIRRINIVNLFDKKRDVRLFFHHDFRIMENALGDTASYDPATNSVVHYKGKRYFLISVHRKGKKGIDQFATGYKQFRELEGTWKDAENGVLGGNPIAQGSVDSTVGANIEVEASGKALLYYVIIVGKHYNDVRATHNDLLKRGPNYFISRTENYWRMWVNKTDFNFVGLPEPVIELFKKSLLILRTQIDNHGAIIAANDTDILHFGRDTYSYMWPRDGALVAYALGLSNNPDIAERFFTFCSNVVMNIGFLFHKYNPDGSIGSSWHPWLSNGTKVLPIQEDETGLVLWALWKHFERFRNIDFIRSLYTPLITPAADFMVNYRHTPTGLPDQSYDLWEERRGIHAFTTSTVYAGLLAASRFAELFMDTAANKRYTIAANEIKSAMSKYLYSKELNRFVRMILPKDDGFDVDTTIDASLYGIFKFGMYETDDPRVVNTMKAIKDVLLVKTDIGGVARYENDYYHRVSKDIKNVPGNPWFICTLWLAQYYIAHARTLKELKLAIPTIEWAVKHAMPSGILAEQLDPYTVKPLSVSPLTWSHGEFVTTVMEFIEKTKSLTVSTILESYHADRIKT
ncbi:glycoside hydrolase family 15 protein [Methanosarcinales archaeon]|nr:MAG: glycoside hydrolase family 15 protein [Methanosarcinales archaeon]